MEENEKRRGTGIFLGVVAVATLVVAIIGATFAYFSITAESAENAIDLQAYEFAATLSVSPVYPSGTGYNGLIPLDPDAQIGTSGKYNLLYAMNEATNRCVDSYGYQVCAVYSLTFENNSSEPMTLSGTLKTTSNKPAMNGDETDPQPKEGRTAFTDLRYRMASGSLNSLAFDTETSGSDTVTIVRNVPSEEGTTVALNSITVPANDTLTKYVVIYLDGTNDTNESGVDQSAQMGATYSGQLIFESSAGSKLTGTFNIGG